MRALQIREGTFDMVFGVDAVRKRPGVYIGPTDDGIGLHNMICNVVHRAVKVALAGHATRIDVSLNADGSATVRDDGRGMPTSIDDRFGRSTAEVLMTDMRGHDEFDWRPEYESMGLSVLDVYVVNALSEWLELRIWRDGAAHFVRFQCGVANAPLVTRDEPSGKHGAEIVFRPDAGIFTSTAFDGPKLKRSLDELARLKNGLEIVFSDLRPGAN